MAAGVPVPAAEPARPRRPFLREVGRDARVLAVHPVHAARDRPGRLAAWGAVTLALYGFRDTVRDTAQANRSPGRARLLDGARTMGKGAIAPALALGAWLSSRATGREKERETSRLLLESAAFSAAGAYLGSFVLATERPRDGNAVRCLHQDGHGVSMDAALAGSLIAPLHRQYLRVQPGDGPWRRLGKRSATAALWAGALLTAYQRVDANAHYAPDVFLGLALGHSVGNVLCTAHGVPGGHGPRLSATAVPGGAALVLRVRTRR